MYSGRVWQCLVEWASAQKFSSLLNSRTFDISIFHLLHVWCQYLFPNGLLRRNERRNILIFHQWCLWWRLITFLEFPLLRHKMHILLIPFYGGFWVNGVSVGNVLLVPYTRSCANPVILVLISFVLLRGCNFHLVFTCIFFISHYGWMALLQLCIPFAVSFHCLCHIPLFELSPLNAYFSVHIPFPSLKHSSLLLNFMLQVLVCTPNVLLDIIYLHHLMKTSLLIVLWESSESLCVSVILMSIRTMIFVEWCQWHSFRKNLFNQVFWIELC